MTALYSQFVRTRTKSKCAPIFVPLPTWRRTPRPAPKAPRREAVLSVQYTYSSVCLCLCVFVC